MEPLIMERPTKSMPKPDRIPPRVFILSLLAKVERKAPTPAKAEKITVVDTMLPPTPLRATIWPVMVVPMLAP